MRFTILSLLICLMLSACSGDERLEHLIAEDTYTDLLVELQVLKSYQQQTPPDSINADSLRRALFNRYDVTEEQFRESHEYYQEDVDKQRDRIKDAIEKLRKDHLAPRDSTATDTTDSAGTRQKPDHPHQ